MYDYRDQMARTNIKKRLLKIVFNKSFQETTFTSIAYFPDNKDMHIKCYDILYDHATFDTGAANSSFGGMKTCGPIYVGSILSLGKEKSTFVFLQEFFSRGNIMEKQLNITKLNKSTSPSEYKLFEKPAAEYYIKYSKSEFFIINAEFVIIFMEAARLEFRIGEKSSVLKATYLQGHAGLKAS